VVRPVADSPCRGTAVPAAVRWPALAEDLKTEWVPDAVGGACIDPHSREPDGPPQQIDVAMASGTRRVPLAPIAVRVRGHLAAQRHLPAIERALAPGVHGYRDADTPYRVEWARMRALLDTNAASRGGGWILRADVKSFFSEASAIAVESAAGAGMGAFCRDVERAHGQALLPGHRWARRTANVLLGTVDHAVGAPFVRWQDDYTVFVADACQAREVLERIDAGLARVGLRRNAQKTRAGPAHDLMRAVRPGAGRPVWRAAKESGDVASLKRLLREAAEGGTAMSVDGLAETGEQFPTLVPRICWLLATRAGENAAASELCRLAESDDIWTAARALAAAAAAPGLAPAVSDAALQRQAGSAVLAVRALAARLLQARGLAWPASLPHVDRLLERASPEELAACRPVVATTL
jgi:hypothetical protein